MARTTSTVGLYEHPEDISMATTLICADDAAGDHHDRNCNGNGNGLALCVGAEAPPLNSSSFMRTVRRFSTGTATGQQRQRSSGTASTSPRPIVGVRDADASTTAVAFHHATATATATATTTATDPAALDGSLEPRKPRKACLGGGAICTPSELQDGTNFVRATVAIHAAILFWVGAWSLASPVKKFRPERALDPRLGGSDASASASGGKQQQDIYTNHWVAVPNTLETHVAYIIAGLALCLVSDTFYGNAGSCGAHTPAGSWLAKSRAWFALRMPMAMAGSILLWVGVYNFLDMGLVPDTARSEHHLLVDLCFIASGLLGLVCTSTLPWCSSVSHTDNFWDNDVTSESTLGEHARFALRCLCSIVAQNCLWLGLYDLLENYEAAGSKGHWRELVWFFVGGMAMSMTGAYLSSSWCEFPKGEGEELAAAASEGSGGFDGDGGKVPRANVVCTLKMVAAYIGIIAHNTGAWTLADFCFDNTPERAAAYMVIGVVLMLASGSFLANFALALPEQADGHGDGDGGVTLKAEGIYANAVPEGCSAA